MPWAMESCHYWVDMKVIKTAELVKENKPGLSGSNRHREPGQRMFRQIHQEDLDRSDPRYDRRRNVYYTGVI